MPTDRQIAANRCNAAKSTGPRTTAGKRRSRANALQHGLTAETVVPDLEDAEAYRALEDALTNDFGPQTVIEHQLVARLASLMWRLRRASLIETGLFEIQGRILQQRRLQERTDAGGGAMNIFYQILHQPNAGPLHANIDEAVMLPSDAINSNTDAGTRSISDVPLAFLRLCKFNDGAIERLGRYEISLWRQTVQVLLLFRSRKENQLNSRDSHITCSE